MFIQKLWKICWPKKLIVDDHIDLNEVWNAITQQKLPPKMEDPNSFNIPWAIGLLEIGIALCDLRENINQMYLSMMRKQNYRESKATKNDTCISI